MRMKRLFSVLIPAIVFFLLTGCITRLFTGSRTRDESWVKIKEGSDWREPVFQFSGFPWGCICVVKVVEGGYQIVWEASIRADYGDKPPSEIAYGRLPLGWKEKCSAKPIEPERTYFVFRLLPPSWSMPEDPEAWVPWAREIGANLEFKVVSAPDSEEKKIEQVILRPEWWDRLKHWYEP